MPDSSILSISQVQELRLEGLVSPVDSVPGRGTT